MNRNKIAAQVNDLVVQNLDLMDGNLLLQYQDLMRLAILDKADQEQTVLAVDYPDVITCQTLLDKSVAMHYSNDDVTFDLEDLKLELSDVKMIKAKMKQMHAKANENLRDEYKGKRAQQKSIQGYINQKKGGSEMNQ